MINRYEVYLVDPLFQQEYANSKHIFYFMAKLRMDSGNCRVQRLVDNGYTHYRGLHFVARSIKNANDRRKVRK